MTISFLYFFIVFTKSIFSGKTSMISVFLFIISRHLRYDRRRSIWERVIFIGFTNIIFNPGIGLKKFIYESSNKLRSVGGDTLTEYTSLSSKKQVIKHFGWSNNNIAAIHTHSGGQEALLTGKDSRGQTFVKFFFY